MRYTWTKGSTQLLSIIFHQTTLELREHVHLLSLRGIPRVTAKKGNFRKFNTKNAISIVLNFLMAYLYIF